jgi:bifunctional non-homologous end joining protein LigD
MEKNGYFAGLPQGLKGKLVKSSRPPWVRPMLATLTEERFFKEGWIYEPKLDGVRCLAFKGDDGLHLYSRNRNVISDRHPGIAEALRRQPAQRFILDGEIVAFEGDRSSFSLLQKRHAGVSTYYYVFDILYFEGYDVTSIPLLGRKALLEQALSYADPIRYLAPIPGAGEDDFLKACEKGWEGLVAKRADSLYTSRRSADWLKFKCVNQQEFVIGGYTEPRGTRSGFGALLLGYYEGKDLKYAGKVGTGFNQRTLEDLKQKLSRMEQPRTPFRDDDLDGRGVHWVRPELVAQVGFSEWTPEGRLRHPRFQGLRTDVEPGEVKRE